MAYIEGASSSSASLSTNSWKYDVFLSFRGVDTRNNFTGHLYSALCRYGINTYKDDELERGEEISTALLKAIEDSKISIIVFSENYASSKWCLEELVKILDCKESKQQMVLPVFYNVDPSDVRNHGGSFGEALANMEKNNNWRASLTKAAKNLFGWHLSHEYKDNMEKVNKWRDALTEAGKLSGWHLLREHDESKIIQNIVEKISIQVRNRTYLDVAKYPVGMQPRIRDMDEHLDLGESNVRMVGVWGTGGIGKSTIAKAVYNSILHKFEGSCFLANVRDSSMSAGGLAELQRTLLFEILRGKKFEVTNVDKGVTMIKEMLSHRKVLVVLDDVNNKEQLEKLAGGCDWFGVGSRIIITTRDKKLLTAHHVNSRSIYKVKGLCYQEALELFSWNAFNRTAPPIDYVELAEHALRCAGGLPLVLRVLGSHLHGESTDKWQSVLDGLIKGRELQEIFKISYNALDDRVKEVFLDIACFFKGGQRNHVMEILEGCNLNPRYGIGVLIDKALIDIDSYDQIWMHDLLEEMGKDVVHQESPTEPGERSRLWFHKDVRHVLEENAGTNKITGIVLNLPEENDDEICLNPESFSKMKNLRIFITRNARFTGEVGYLSNQLRVIDWYGCPLQSFPPNFRPKELVVLKIPNNRIRQLGDGLKLLTKLTSLNLSYSEFLTEIPDLSGVPNLKYLNASDCINLVGVHPSVGYLDKLKVLDFQWCPKLTKFPPKVSLKSLKEFNLGNCKKFERFPEIADKIESDLELVLWGTAIKELPSSIGLLTGLGDLILSDLDIAELPSSIGLLTGVSGLFLRRLAIAELPSSIGHLTGLEELHLDGCGNLTNLPQSVYGLQHLRKLDLSYCPKLVTLPKSIPESFALEGPTKMSPSAVPKLFIIFRGCNVSDFVENLCSSFSPSYIDLSESNFVSLPVGISKFINLWTLRLQGCKRLEEISEPLPPSTRRIDVSGCKSLEIFTTMSKIVEDGDTQLFEEINLGNCHKLCHKLGLDVSKMANILRNQIHKDFQIEVILPGSEIPEWFSCREDEVDILSHVHVVDILSHVLHSVFEIPWNFKWNDSRLVICLVFKHPSPRFEVKLIIGGALVAFIAVVGWLESTRTESDNVYLKYIPDFDTTLAEVDIESDQLTSYTCHVALIIKPQYGNLKSWGVHLLGSMSDGDEDVDGGDLEDENEDELDDDSHQNGDDDAACR